MRPWLIPFAALALTACGKPAEDAAPAPAPPAGAWSLAGEAGHSTLSFAVDGKAPRVGIACADGSGKLELTAALQDQVSMDQPVGGKWLHTFMLQAREEVEPYPADATKTAQGTTAMALANVDDPVFTAFAASGEITIDGHDAAASTAAGRAAIQRFFQTCAEAS